MSKATADMHGFVNKYIMYTPFFGKAMLRVCYNQISLVLYIIDNNKHHDNEDYLWKLCPVFTYLQVRFATILTLL